MTTVTIADRSTIIVMLALLAGLGLVACNTVDGAGEDIESLGEGMQNVSNQGQDDFSMTGPFASIQQQGA